MEQKTALVVGASGLVGRELLQVLLKSENYYKITALVRTSLNINNPKLDERIIDFDQLDDYQGLFLKVNDVFCALGTTIKKAKTQEAFKKVDLDYPLKVAELARSMEVEKFLIVSSMGADPNSKFFYMNTKGQMEKRLEDLKLTSLHIFRPSLLLGKRKEVRFGEGFGAFLAKLLFFLFVGPLKKHRPIKASTVAMAMYKTAQRDTKGTFIYLSDEISQKGD